MDLGVFEGAELHGAHPLGPCRPRFSNKPPRFLFHKNTGFPHERREDSVSTCILDQSTEESNLPLRLDNFTDVTFFGCEP